MLKCNIAQTIRQNLASLLLLVSERIQESKKVDSCEFLFYHTQSECVNISFYHLVALAWFLQSIVLMMLMTQYDVFRNDTSICS